MVDQLKFFLPQVFGQIFVIRWEERGEKGGGRGRVGVYLSKRMSARPEVCIGRGTRINMSGRWDRILTEINREGDQT
jgi:hypothetical protein